MKIFYLIGCMGFIFFQGFFAACEISFISSSLLKLRSMRGKNKNAHLAYMLLLRPEKFLATALVGTNISVIISTTLATSFLISMEVPNSNVWVTLLFTPMIVIFAELVPKNIGRYYREEFGVKVAGVYRWAEIMFFPFISGIEKVSVWLVGKVVGKVKKRSVFVNREEIKALVKEIEIEGVLEKGEKEAIEDIFEFGETKLKDVCLPLSKVIGIDYADSFDRILSIGKSKGFTRYPVFRNRDIVGYINIFDLFYGTSKEWYPLIRPITHVGASQKLYEVFTLLKNKKENIAVVRKGKKMIGLVTLEDLIKEILGSIAK